MRDLLRRRPLLLDVLIALMVTVAGQVEAWTADLEGGSRAATVLPALAATAALALRRTRPAAGAFVVVAALLLKEALQGSDELVVMLLCGVVATFSVGAQVPSPRSVLVLVGLLAVASLAVLFGDQSVPGELLFTALVTGAPWAAGRVVRDRTERAALLEDLARRREREARDHVRLAAAEERARIARELHDLVGHSVSLMVLQAGAAEQVVHERPDRAAASLSSIQSTGRGAIDELRRVLGLLRDGAGSGDHDPLPDLRQLEALVVQVRDAGLQVALEVQGDPGRLPKGVSLAAFRIVQEALTNVLKHAPGAGARVSVRCTPQLLSLEVIDDGAAVAAPNPSGHGLVGIRERVGLYGGTAEIGPHAGAGFRVAATLPLNGPAS